MQSKNCAVDSASVAFLTPLSMAVALLFAPAAAHAQTSDASASPRPLLIAFSSLRDRPAFASLYLYRHDGLGNGSMIATVPVTFERGDTRPSLSADGALCLYTSKQVGGFSPQLQFFDVLHRQILAGPAFNSEFGARTDASLSGSGKLITFCVWDSPGQAGGWDVMVYDREATRFIELPGLNSEYNEREVAISGDGRLLAFVSDRPGTLGASDIYCYDCSAKRLVALPGVNSHNRELNPTLSSETQLLAFVSDRPGGTGGKDIYISDRQTQEVVSPPGLNSPGHEQTPAFSPDGRYLVFISERVRGAGERDIYLYDRVRGRLLDTPGLNSPAEDFDPCIGWAPK